MSTGTLIFLLLVIGLPLAMMLMHRGGHGQGMGGCGMGHGGHGQGGHDDRREPTRDDQPVLGKPGEPSGARERSREQHAHRGHGRC